MDGGSKFVKGDAIAAIIITVINLVGGFVVGVAQKGMPLAEAAETYSLLSVGDGLVSQIPALLLSVATGLIVTRSATSGTMGGDLATQFAEQKQALRLGGGGVMLLCLIPGLPKLPFLLVGGAGALRLEPPARSDDDDVAARSRARGAAAPPPAPDSPEVLANDMRVDPLALELAPDLVDLVDGSAGGDLLDRVTRAAPQGRPRPRPGHPARPHPGQPRAAAVDVRHQGRRRRRRPRRGADRHGAGHRRGPRRAARPPDPGAGLRPGRPVDPGRAAPPGRAARRHGRRPRVGHHHAHGRGGPRARLPPAQPRGRQAAGRVGQAHVPGGGRGAGADRAEPRRGAARAAGAARRAGVDPRPAPHLRGAVAQGAHRAPTWRG